MRALREATHAFAVEWYRRVHADDRYEGLDYSDAHDEWAEIREREAHARRIRSRLRGALGEHLAFVGSREPSGTLVAGMLAKTAKTARALQRSLEPCDAITTRRAERPSRRNWLNERVKKQYGRRGGLKAIPTIELAVYSLLGGWWPTNIRNTGRDGVSVARVLGQEKKYIRKALR